MSDLTVLIGLLKDNASIIAPGDVSGFETACDDAITEDGTRESNISTIEGNISTNQTNITALQSGQSTLSASVSSLATNVNGAKLGKSVGLRFDEERF